MKSLECICILGILLFLDASCNKNVADIPPVLFAPGGANRPSVLYSSPSSLTPNVPVDAQIFVEFDRDMDAEKTQQAFSLSGSAPTPGKFEWQGKRLVYRLDSQLVAGNSFLLTQGGNAKSRDGYLMEVDYLVHFVAGNSIVGPQVLSTVPANNSQNVNTGATIRYIFSAPMDQASTQSALSISPSAPGTFTWDPDLRGVTYTPFSPLTFATTYTAQITVGARDTSGIPMASTNTLTFQAGTDFTAPTIVNVYEVGNVVPLVSGVTGIKKDSSIRIDFSEPVQFLATQGSFGLVRTSNSTSVSGVYQWNGTFTSLTFVPNSPLEPLNQYRLTLGTGTLDIAGNTLQSTFVLDFTVDNSLGGVNSNYLGVSDVTKTSPAPPEVLSLVPSALTVLSVPGCATGQTMNLTVTFDHSLNLSSVAQNISFTKTLGINIHTGQIIGLSFSTSVYPNDRLTLLLNDVGCNEYELKVFGQSGGIKSATSGSETGTWLQDHSLTYMRVQ